ncbi:Tat pathway signal sequence domain protein [Brevundimonas naejangsanensis]|uniref:Tat pathway signal sequence domain protein n=1 Tax=Brevundimonas naejangsanensis TaxID=588932 RepID=A0A494RD75_9CAUL|nr:Tat pathway signal sequence domain protein [Brevundimonas naejangsanensis]AYG94081.1 Tat pathway signal sequence domain protein [Brevundimonas naejangsanensis]
MRRVLTALAALSLAAALIPHAAEAQSGRQQGGGGKKAEQAPSRPMRIAPLNRRANAGPCPYVKILYDAARYVEMSDYERPTTNSVGFTGEIEGVSADCAYREADPIRLDVNLLFSLGKGPQAQGDARTYRYWIAVTERNSAVLAKEYFDLPVTFNGADRTQAEASQTIVIPRADATTSGGNFEVLIGFDVTPQMAEFNRSGSRFRPTAGQQTN